MNGCAYRIASADGALLRTPAGDPAAPGAARSPARESAPRRTPRFLLALRPPRPRSAGGDAPPLRARRAGEGRRGDQVIRRSLLPASLGAALIVLSAPGLVLAHGPARRPQSQPHRLPAAGDRAHDARLGSPAFHRRRGPARPHPPQRGQADLAGWRGRTSPFSLVPVAIVALALGTITLSLT